MSDLHSGGCQCGALRYQFRAPLRDIAHCHCSVCRRCSGGIVTTWIDGNSQTIYFDDLRYTFRQR